MIFDHEDGCWLPAGLDSDTFPILADPPLVGGAFPFGHHVSRRAGPGRAGQGRAGSAGRGCRWSGAPDSVPRSRGVPARGGGERARRGSGEAGREERAAGRGDGLRTRASEGPGAGAARSRATSADGSRRLSPSLPGFLTLKEFTGTRFTGEGRKFPATEPLSSKRSLHKKLCCGRAFDK